MILLILAALLWVGVHVGISGTSRRRGRRTGPVCCRVAYSVGSVLAIALLVQAWQAADTAPLWFAPAWLRWLLALAVLPAFVLFACSLMQAGGRRRGLLARGPRRASSA